MNSTITASQLITGYGATPVQLAQWKAFSVSAPLRPFQGWTDDEINTFMDLAHEAGFTPSARARKSYSGIASWFTACLKLAHSKHPHMAKWRPLLQVYQVARVVNKLT
jgi:hypothetical protein